MRGTGRFPSSGNATRGSSLGVSLDQIKGALDAFQHQLGGMAIVGGNIIKFGKELPLGAGI